MKQAKTAYGGYHPATDPKNGVAKQADTAPAPPKFGGGSNADAARAVRIAQGKGGGNK